MNTSCLTAPYFAGLLRFGSGGDAASLARLREFPGPYFDFSGGSLAASSPEGVLITPDLLVVADLGLHNESEVRRRLGMAAREGTPAQLIARAYRQWGEKIPEQLTGEFVFLIWNRQSEQVLVSRDRFGFRSFYYHYQPGTHFAFASRISRVPTFAPPHTAIDCLKVRNFLAPETAHRSFEERTFYQTIKAALPAHQLTIQAGQKSQRCYWKINPERYGTITREEEYIELFRSFFFDSVRKCTAGYAQPGAHLSGGLDSSSVACVAREVAGDMATFYINPNLKSTDETYFVRAVQQRINSRHYEGRPDPDVYRALARLSRLFDRPEHFPLPSSFHFAAADRVQQAGCDVVLTGHDGDAVVGHGTGLIDAYRDAEDWPSLRRAIGQYARERDLSHLSPDWLLRPATERESRYARHYLTNELWTLIRQKNVGEFLKTARTFSSEFGYPYRSFLYSGLDKLAARLKLPPSPNLLNRESGLSLLQNEANDRADGLYTGLSAGYLGQFQEITHQSYVDATEQLHHIGCHYGHRYAHPFFDEQLIELSLAIPERIKFGGGKGRATIRRALKDLLPPEVLDRGHKTSFSEYGLLSFQDLYLQTLPIFGAGHRLWEFVDKVKFERVAKVLSNPAIPLNQKSRYYAMAAKALFLGVWLEEMKTA